ncbi:MAG: outer membrane protein assembly factor BamE [Steroidobacteraceae bacterium]
MTTDTMRPTHFPATFLFLLRGSRALAALALFSTLAVTAGCIYRMPIQQGNVLDPIQVSQLETGMTRSQVMFLLGTPMVPNGFDTERWDYYYYVQAGRKLKPYSKRMTVYFKDEKVDRIERADDVANGPATPASEFLPPEPAAVPPTAAPPGTPPASGPLPGGAGGPPRR